MDAEPLTASELAHTWRFSSVIRRQPVCPICAQPLHPGAVQWDGQVAFCRICVYMPDLPLSEVRSLLDEPEMSRYVIYDRGLRYYVGPRHGRVMTALDLAAQIGIDANAAPGTPGTPAGNEADASPGGKRSRRPARSDQHAAGRDG